MIKVALLLVISSLTLDAAASDITRQTLNLPTNPTSQTLPTFLPLNSTATQSPSPTTGCDDQYDRWIYIGVYSITTAVMIVVLVVSVVCIINMYLKLKQLEPPQRKRIIIV
jgi:disulfide bond formation protein DsbB